MKTYSVTEAKERFSQVIESVIQGEEIIVKEYDKAKINFY